MGDQPEPRLAIAVALLTLQALLIVSQYLVSVQDRRRRKCLPGPAFLESLILLFPIFVAVLGIILIAVMFTSKDPESCKAKIDELCKDDKRCRIDGVCKIDGLCKIDDDIGGRGIRFAAWAQLGVLLFLALIGIFHTKTTGIKEVAASLTITHLALVIALLVKLNNLEAADAILGTMILDSQNNALSIPLMTKATLGARWQVWTIVSCQAFGLAVLGVLVHKFHQNHFKVCCKKCVSVIWWGRLGTHGRTSGLEQTIFWLYYACRVLSIAQSSYQALRDTYAFHKAEKSGQLVESKTFHPLYDNNSLLKRFFRKLLRIREYQWKFLDYPTTLSLTFLVGGVFAVASMVAAEAAMTKDGFDTQSDDFTTGQIIAVVVAVAGMIIGVWRFMRLFLESEHGGTWRCWFFAKS